MSIKTTGHTPGPWRINGSAIEGCQERRYDVIICGVDYYADGAKANARLIASAPDLLEACRALIDAVEALDDYIRAGVPANQQRKGEDAVKRARAVLAKAEGKEGR